MVDYFHKMDPPTCSGVAGRASDLIVGRFASCFMLTVCCWFRVEEGRRVIDSC